MSSEEFKREHTEPKKPTESAGRSQKPSDQAIAKFKAVWPEAGIEFIAGTVNGKGRYVIETFSTVSRRTLSGIGIPNADRLDAYRVIQWRVPPEVMEEVVPGAMEMSPKQLTEAIRNKKIPGHKNTKVHNMRSHEEGHVVMDVRGDEQATSRSSFVGENGNKDQIRMYNLGRKYIIVPEEVMHRALEVESGRRY